MFYGGCVEAQNGSTWLAEFFDDASAFPPASVPIDRAVAAYRAHQQGEVSGLLGNLVVPDVKLPDLIDAVDALDDTEETDWVLPITLPITLLVTGGAGAVGPAIRWASRAPMLDLRTIEVALRDEDDLAHNAQRFLTAVDAVDDDISKVSVFVELPRWYDAPSQGWLRALDEIAAAEWGAKFRIGGAEPATFPSPADLATCFDAALDRELPYRCTGSAVPAITHVDPDSGLTRYGFVNLLVATRGCLEGEDAAVLLSERSADVLLKGRDAETLTRTRRWLRGISTPNLLEAHDDLVELGLLEPE